MLGNGHAASRDLARGPDRFTGDTVTSAPAVGTLRATHLRALLADEDEEALEGALERRAVIERAKGMLMERHGVDEHEAFQRLRDHARATSQRLVDVAEGVLDGHMLRPQH